MTDVPLAVVIPGGPADDVRDTLDSVLHYTSPPRLVVVVDDTGGHLQGPLEERSGDVRVIQAPPGAPGALGGLFAKLSAGFRHALDTFPFDVLLRLDADALVIGPGLAEAAKERFGADPGLGMLGSCRVRSDGCARSFEEAARVLGRECGWRGLDRPSMRAALRALRRAALEHGYVAGEHALGGAYLLSADAVGAIAQQGWLDLWPLRASRLGEDHLFAMATVAAGFRLGDFGGPGDPLALRWKGLPAEPAVLLEEGKLVTHSVRSFEALSEPEIRAAFAAARSAELDRAATGCRPRAGR